MISRGSLVVNGRPPVHPGRGGELSILRVPVRHVGTAARGPSLKGLSTWVAYERAIITFSSRTRHASESVRNGNPCGARGTRTGPTEGRDR